MKKSNFYLSALFVLSSSIPALAQNPHADRLDPAALNQQGQLLNLRVVPSDKTLQIFLTGKKGAEIKLDDAKVTAKLRLANRPAKELLVKRQNAFFAIPADELKNKDATKLELTTNTGKESETFMIDLK